MPLHDIELFGSELARFVQNLIWNGDFPDVVHGRCRANDADVVFADIVFVRAAHQFPQEHFGDGVDV